MITWGIGGNEMQVENIAVAKSKCKLVIYDMFLDLNVSRMTLYDCG
jgi:hypothetical protein